MSPANKFFCAHGHFYQPPRENPWLGEVEPEESAHPYRDWNCRIFEECYGPNAAAPLPAEDGRIAELADNYRLMSFNFGPTLLSWLERRRPFFYRQLLESDRQSALARDGHGNAIAQPYYHAILPLQNLRDKRTLVRWGVEDFRRRFGREPEGLWLPETAVDEETLEVLIEAGIGFTVLSPAQAARVRDIGSGEAGWRSVSSETLIPTRPYRWLSRAQPGKHLAIFFYHQGLARDVVSGEALVSADAFARKVLSRTHPDDSTQLISVASDGEFYGHHHSKGASVLAQALRALEASGVALTNYAEFLGRLPPPQEVEIRPNTAWSCEHGLGRWTEDCGCRSSRHPKWRQTWRKPLREALNALARECDALYERAAGGFFQDYRRARENYARRLSDPSASSARDFIAEEALPSLAGPEASSALKLLELERHRLAMFTSCGWFFDDISGLESVLCLKHAARAIELAAEFGADLAPAFKEVLSQAPSNVKNFSDGAKVYSRLVEPLRADFQRAAAHFALLAHLDQDAPSSSYGFAADKLKVARRAKEGLAGRDRAFSWSQWKITRLATLEESSADAVVLQRDRLDVSCWTQLGQPIAGEELARLFDEREDEACQSEITSRLGARYFGLDALSADERRNALRLLMPSPLQDRARREFFGDWGRAVAALRRGGDGEEALQLLSACKGLGIKPDQLPWLQELRDRLLRLLWGILSDAGAQELARALRWTRVFEDCGLHVSLWEFQNFFWRWRLKILGQGASPGEREAALALGEKLNFSDSALAPIATGAPA